ncbi:MAG: SHD1 domain-containing protein [Pirellulales bacterium]
MSVEFLLPALVSLVAASAMTTVKGPLGDIVTFTPDRGLFAFLVFGGVAFAAIGCGTLWLTRRFLGGRMMKLSLTLIFTGIAMPIGAFNMRNDQARVTPDEVDLTVNGKTARFLIADIRNQGLFKVDGPRGDVTWHCNFVLLNGSEYSYPQHTVAGDVFDYVSTVRSNRLAAAPEPEAPPKDNAPDAAIRAGAAMVPQQPQRLQKLTTPVDTTPPVDASRWAAKALPTPSAASIERSARERMQAMRKEMQSVAKATPRPRAASVGSSAAERIQAMQAGHPTTVHQLPAGAKQVTADTPLTIHMPVIAKWGAAYYGAVIMALRDDGKVRIHYDGHGDAFDEDALRENLWISVELDQELNSAPSNGPLSVDENADRVETPIHLAKDDPAGVRTWTDNTGNHTIEAKLELVTDGKVTLLRTDGKRITLSLERLSAADQELATRFSRAESDK